MRFDPALLAGLKRAVKAKRARDLTDALEAAAAAWLGVERGVPSSVDAPAAARAATRTVAAKGKRKPRAAAPRGEANGKAAHRTVAPSAQARAGVRPIPKGTGKGKR